MCWSSEVSIISFFIGTFVSYTLLKRGNPYDKTLSMLIGFYSFVQLYEFFMWESLKGKSYILKSPQDLNALATKLVYINLYSHALAMGYGLYLDTGNTTLLKIGGILFLYGMITMPSFKPKGEFLSRPSHNGHLMWDFDNRFYVIVSALIIYFLYNYTNTKYTGIAILFYIITYIISFTTQGDGSASYWCWISAFLSFYTLV